MADTYKVLGQALTGQLALDNATIKETIAYEVPTGAKTSVSAIEITNSASSSQAYNVAFVPNAEVDSNLLNVNYAASSWPNNEIPVESFLAFVAKTSVNFSEVTLLPTLSITTKLPFSTGNGTQVTRGANGIYVIYGVYTNNILASTDSTGDTWQLITPSVVMYNEWNTSQLYMETLEYLPASGVYVSTSADSPPGEPPTTYSYNLTTWWRANIPTRLRMTNAVTLGNKVYGLFNNSVMYTTTDGINWTYESNNGTLRTMQVIDNQIVVQTFDTTYHNATYSTYNTTTKQLNQIITISDPSDKIFGAPVYKINNSYYIFSYGSLSESNFPTFFYGSSIASLQSTTAGLSTITPAYPMDSLSYIFSTDKLLYFFVSGYAYGAYDQPKRRLYSSTGDLSTFTLVASGLESGSLLGFFGGIEPMQCVSYTARTTLYTYTPITGPNLVQQIPQSLNKHIAVYNKTIAPGQTHEIKGGITLSAGDQIRVYSSSAEVVTNVYGVEIV